MALLKQAEARTPPPDLCRRHNIGSAAFCKWWSKNCRGEPRTQVKGIIEP